jgi:hypothetical protein
MDWTLLEILLQKLGMSWNTEKTVVVNSSEYGMKNNCKNDSIDIFLEKKIAINWAKIQ